MLQFPIPAGAVPPALFSMMVWHVRSVIFWFILGGLCAFCSCHSLEKPASTVPAPHAPAVVNQPINSVTVEIFKIPIAPHQNALLQQLWREVDEQSLPPQLRRELLAQGFRAGVLGNLISPALAQLLKVSSEGKADIHWKDFQEVSVADATREFTVTRTLCTLSPEMRGALIRIFDAPLPELSLFWKENEMVCGQTYKGALGLISISAVANKDGSAQIQIVPELEHGILELQIRTVSGLVVQERSRPRRTFELLTVSQRLLPGQWLILGTTTLDSAGAGKAFFSRQASVPEQRLLAIRFVHAALASPAQSPAPQPVSKGTEPIMPERN